MTELHESDRQRLFRSVLISVCFWCLLAVVFSFIPILTIPKPKPVFTTVKLTLNQIPAPAPEPEPVTAPAPLPKPATEETKPSATKTAAVQKPLPKAQPASATAPTANATAPPATTAAPTANATAPTANATAFTGLGIPNFSSPVTSSPEKTGEDEFLDFSSNAETQRPRSALPSASSKAVPEFEGKAAAVQKNTDSGVIVGKTGNAKSSGVASAATEATSKSLAQIVGQAQTGTVSKANEAKTEGAATGRTSILSGLTFDGTPRKLLYPAEPAIILPADLARLIDADKKVTVQFTVRPDGSVPGGRVSFNPSALLPAKIQDYLRSEFSRWRFEKSTLDGQATFQYSIKVR